MANGRLSMFYGLGPIEKLTFGTSKILVCAEFHFSFFQLLTIIHDLLLTRDQAKKYGKELITVFIFTRPAIF
jgi:hypothetical protein